jgi:hypothetical protein
VKLNWVSTFLGKDQSEMVDLCKNGQTLDNRKKSIISHLSEL